MYSPGMSGSQPSRRGSVLTTGSGRPYAGQHDLLPLFDVLVAAKDAGIVDLELRSTTLRHVLSDPTFEHHNTLLIEDDSRLIGFGILMQGRYLEMLVHPDQRGRIEDRILDWAGTAAAKQPWFVLCRSDDTLWREMFEDRGFRLNDEELRMRRALHLPIDPPHLPSGFAIRPLRGEAELPAWIASYESAFGSGHGTIQRRLAFLRDPDYDPELDLIATAPDGALAALCACAVEGYEARHCRVREGKLGPVAVAEPFRRHGLGRAVVSTALQLLRDRGLDVAVLDTDMENPPAHELYAALGFRRDYTACWYASPVPS